MKIKFLLCSLIICEFWSYTANAQGGTLPLNGSVNGTITANATDTWLVTTNADGLLQFTITTNDPGDYVDAVLYDNNGTTVIGNVGTATPGHPVVVSNDGLAAGTYFIKVYAYSAPQTPAYTLANTLTPAPVANDIEPNNSRAQAETLTLNDSATGHVGYYYNNLRDSSDWYKVTTTSDGLLRLTITTEPSTLNAYINCTLYDNNGTIVLNSNTTGHATTTVLSTDGLAAGTYYVKMSQYSVNDYVSYKLADSLFTAPVANDKETNNSHAQAEVLTLNDSTTGHVGYYYNNLRDSSDWYKVTTTSDGLFRLTITTEPSTLNAYINCTLYDNNGIIVLNSNTTGHATTTVLSTDGLAAGTYYVKMSQYSVNDYVSYKLADSLFTAPVANDKETNNSHAQAETLTLNDSATGHVGYYYNNLRDSSDWYKVTTTSDGLLRLTITTEPSTLNAYINCTLYDNNGTIVLNSNTTGHATTTVLSTDGLAAGTYYVKMSQYSVNDYVSYKLADSLFTAPVANDKETNNSHAQAEVLTLNDSTTGHVGYYYNNLRDSSDWYKVTTTSDGLFRLTITTEPSTLNAYINCTLYDNNGIIVLNSNTTGHATTTVLSTDGLAAGTYYVKMSQYSISDYVSYKLADSLFAYKYAADTSYEPNGYAAQAHTILSDSAITGHFGFYYNNKRDTTDWVKINYTGSGNLSLTINLLPHLSNGQLDYANFYVYKDTSAASVYQTTFSNTSNTVNLTGLTQGYYYFKITQYNSNDFEAYSISNSFTQVSVAAISLLKSANNNTCGTDSLIYGLSGSHSPYTVRLYRNGIFYDSLITTSDSASFIGLNGGNYYATAYGDGATGTAFGKTSSVALLPPVPTGLDATNITGSSATLDWSMLPCINYDTVEYRASDTAAWKILITTDNSGVYDLANLADNTTYLFRVSSVVTVNGQKLSSSYSSTFTFKTLSALPVTLVNFSATAHNGLVTLNWSTATEINNKGFEIFRSADGANFTSIGFVAGAGNSDLLLNYQFTDKPGLSGNVFYRLQQIDLDGKFALSNIVSVILESNRLITFMPNPARNSITISSPVVVKEVRLLAVNGRIIKVWQNVSTNAQLDLGSIASGTYLIEFMNDQSLQTMKLVKE